MTILLLPWKESASSVTMIHNVDVDAAFTMMFSIIREEEFIESI